MSRVEIRGERLVGPYRVAERIGEGGMGEVRRAVDTMLEREVALKTLRPELSAREELVERFRVEAIALAHDLGHTPFGHAGQDALHDCMAGHGGFEHNLQSLRVVDRLEARYPAFDGLNLTHETREGILKHCSKANAQALLAKEPDGPAHRFVHGGQPSLEAQLVNLSDELAYSAHDVDDGVRSGLIALEQALDVPVFAHWHDDVRREFPALAGRRLLYESLRRMLSAQVHDLIDHTAATLAAAESQQGQLDAETIRHLPPFQGLSEPFREQAAELKRFLFKALYRHPRVVQMTSLGRRVVAELFAAYTSAPQEMPTEFASTPALHRSVADYIAGMTDRFALREHERLTGQRLFD